ncbi:NFACT family protein [Candidatus Woesearchaeota archaeon]|nr:NFACT family protein [Candidatus Woesearchaeota archaeon]
MKKQLSSIDLHYLVKELQALKDSRIDKIYQPEKELIVFSLYKTNAGKRLLRIDIGKSIFIAEEKESYEEILGFGQFLRKHIDGYFLTEMEQINPERIIKLTFRAKEEKKFLYAEFFGKGNAILCDEHNVIMNALEHHDFRERSIKPKLKYVYPVMSYNLFELKEEDLAILLKNSKKDSLVTSLATELGLGGLYSEEVCLISNIDKSINPKNIDKKQAQLITNSIKKITNKKIEAFVVFDENNNVADVIPFDFEFYKNNQKKSFPAFSEAVSFFFSHFKEPKETEFDKKLKELQRIIESQQQTIRELRKEEHESRQKGELIYQNYQLIKEIIDELNKASKKHSWKEIKEKLKNHKTIKEVNEKERKVIVEI